MVKNGEKFREGLTAGEKVQHILQEIETAQSQKTASQEILERTSSYLAEEPSLTIPLIEALVRVPTPETAQLLIRMMAEAEEKWVIKSIKRTLYKMKQKGVRWEERSLKDKPVLMRPKPVEPQGYLGAIDTVGNRIIVIARPQPLRGLLVILSIVNDLEGIQRFSLREFSKKSFKDFVNDSLASPDFPIVAAPGAYCIYLLKEAAALTKRLSKPLPQGYHDVENEFRDILWEEPLPIVYQAVKEEEVKDQPQLLKESGALHKITPFSAWALTGQQLQQYAESIKEARESKILLTPEQKEARINSVYMKALEELFPEDTKLLWKRRLEEMAYILLKTGKVEEAKSAVSAALNLSKPFSPIEPNPFIWNLLLKSLHSLLEEDYAQKEKEEKSSLIVTP